MTEKMPLLWVEWVDSWASSGPWTGKAGLEEGCDEPVIRSVGWLIHEDDTWITIASHDGGHTLGGDRSIPKVAITGRWEITLK